MRIRVAVTFVLCIAAAAMLAAQDPSPMRPGRWEVTVQMQMPNMPMQMPATKTTTCVTAEQLAKDPTSGLPTGMRDATQSRCKVDDYKFAGNVATWKMVCTEPQAMTADGQMTFMPDAYTGTMTITTPQGAMSMQLAGERLGDCTP